MSAKPTFGVIFKLGPSTPSITLAKPVSVAPPKMTRDAVNVTTHASAGVEEFMPDGVYDPGELQVTMNYIAGDADDDACIAALLATAAYHFSWTANAATGSETFTATGIVTSYGPDDLPVKGKQMASMSIKLTGAITQAPTA